MNAEPSAEVSLEEWAELPEEDRRELVDGHLQEEEVVDFVHDMIVAWLLHVIQSWRSPPSVLVAGSNPKLAVAARRGRMPDATVYLEGAQRPPMRGLIRVPPSIAIEVVSSRPSDQRRDRIEKVDDYAAFQVKWYWLVDPQLRTFEVFELGKDGRYVRALGASEGVVESVPGCEGLRIDLSALWRAIDALEPAER